MGTTDGRHARSERTRERVAEAMLDCLQAGSLRPSAKEVALRAGVSTRAVFRHFENMESLLDQAAAIQMERMFSDLPPLEDQGPLANRIAAFVERTCQGFEQARPVRRASLIAEPFSEVIQARQHWLRNSIRQHLKQVFTPELSRLSEPQQRQRLAAIRSILSSAYWEELRSSEKLSARVAEATLRNILAKLLTP